MRLLFLSPCPREPRFGSQPWTFLPRKQAATAFFSVFQPPNPQTYINLMSRHFYLNSIVNSSNILLLSISRMLSNSSFPLAAAGVAPLDDDFSIYLSFLQDDFLPEMPPAKKPRRAAPEDSDPRTESEDSSQPPPSAPRRLWVKERSRAWWDQCNRPDFPESDFRAAFRMSRATFDMICEELSSVVAKEDTMLRAAIPVRQRVAVCIWRLATGEPLRLVSKRFGLGISTCHKLVLEVCSAIKSVLMPKFLRWPDEPEALDQTRGKFESVSGIPNIVGAMYTTHIPIIAPKENVASYFNRRHTERNQKTSYSISVQGVVNADGVFTDVCIGWPGSMSDEQVLEKSALNQLATRCGLLSEDWVVGGVGHPLLDWVMAPYAHRNLTWAQHAFNERIGEVQRVGKEAFAKLKGRWGCLQKRTEVKLQDLPVVLGACCVLHNICQIRGEELGTTEAGYELFDDEMSPENWLRSVRAMHARDSIAHNLLHSGLPHTGFH